MWKGMQVIPEGIQYQNLWTVRAGSSRNISTIYPPTICWKLQSLFLVPLIIFLGKCTCRVVSNFSHSTNHAFLYDAYFRCLNKQSDDEEFGCRKIDFSIVDGSIYLFGKNFGSILWVVPFPRGRTHCSLKDEPGGGKWVQVVWCVPRHFLHLSPSSGYLTFPILTLAEFKAKCLLL